MVHKFIITVLAITAMSQTSLWAATVQSEVGFPLSPGSSWVYNTLDGNTETVSITRIVTVKGVPLIEVLHNDEYSSYFLRTRNEIYRFDSLPDAGESQEVIWPKLLLKINPSVGETWISPWGDPPLSFTVQSEETYTVPAGTYPNTYKIAYRPITDPIYQGFIWYTPGIGFVAMETNRYRSELVSFSISDLLPPEPVDKEITQLMAQLGIPTGPGPDDTQENVFSIVFSRDFLAKLLIPAILFAAFAVVLIWILRTQRNIDLEDDPGVSRSEIAYASAMLREGLYADAASLLQRQTVKNPQWPDLAALLGHAYSEMGRLEDASLELKRALTLNPDLVSARLDLAKVYLANNDPSKALEELEAVLGKNPEFADAILLRGETYIALGQTNRAEADFRKALKINPSFVEAQAQLEKLKSEG
ncbi:tetratricopeptide repeat protein [bacterium]|nr:MAG: tetratricopeptide repeat protein [bacterium]